MEGRASQTLVDVMAMFLLEASSALVKPRLYDPRLAMLSDRGVRGDWEGNKKQPRSI